MSSYVNKEWFYYLRGRELLLYKLLGGSGNERITQSGVMRTRGDELMYPNEDIADGLRVEYTALNEPFVAEALETTTAVVSGTSLIFQDTDTAFYTGSSDISFAASGNRIDAFDDTSKYFYVGQSIVISGTSSNNGTFTVATIASSIITTTESISDESNKSAVFKNATGAILGGTAGTNTFTDFLAADKIRVQGSASNDADYTISSISSNGDALIVSSVPSALESAGERITVTQISKEVASPDETSHINLNRMLSLALVDYLKAMEADKIRDIQRKEYYMKEFYGKLGDNESNKRNISITFPIQPFAIR
jgi:hypothetical protein